jgi:hypothetical protein
MQFTTVTLVSLLAMGSQVLAAPVPVANPITAIHGAVMSLKSSVTTQVTTISMLSTLPLIPENISTNNNPSQHVDDRSLHRRCPHLCS